MWLLILIGGGIVVVILGPISITGYGSLDQILSSILKAIVAILLVVLWIVILTKMKKWIFVRTIND
jgi:hypothetical protein